MAEIDGYNTTIEKSDVENRIDELEDSAGYDVIRLRNDNVLASFSDEDEAGQYIEDEDYNPERIVIRRQELDEDDARELRDLRRLIDAVDVSGDWTLYNDNFFDADWAKSEATDQLGVPRDAVYEWPLDLVDWDDAARERRDALYEYAYLFDGTTFYGSE
jgi:hypothetical protein